MNKINFDKYKNSLKQYLSLKGVDVNKNPTFCFNPDHTNNDSPAMQIHEDGFKCHGCNVKGDIFDACEMLTGITDKVEQYKEVEKSLIGYNKEDFPEVQKKEKFKPDPECVKEFESFVRNHKGREKGVYNFLNNRGYSDNIISKMCEKFGYWPGFNEAEKVIPKEKLLKAGIPEKAWYNSGVVVRLNFGYKLMFYKNNKCEKRNSLSAKTFPCPNAELSGTVILTEAELSALSMLAAGFENVYSTGGTNGITKYNVDKLLKCEKIIFAYDGDNAGRYFSGLDEYKVDKKTGKKEKPKRPIDKLFDAGFSGIIHTARLPESKDADDLIRGGKSDLLKQLIDKSEIIKKTESKEKPADDKPFHFLGYDDKAYYILPKNQQIFLKINRGETSIKNWIFEGAKEDWWFEKFNTEVETREGEIKTVFDKKAAITWFRESSFKAGIFDEKRIKGVGAHKDGEKILLNSGHDIKICGNGRIKFDEWDGHNFYIRSKRNFKLSDNEWTTEEGKNLWKQINTFSFDKKMDKVAVAGFMVLAPFSSILFRRPSIWISAQKGIGKTFLIDELIIPAIGGEDFPIFTEGLSSEAYIRQSLKRDNVPVVIDEFEAQNQKEITIVKSVLKLNRSSYGGKTMGKGSANHEAVNFYLRSMFCFGSVNVIMDNDADRSRIHICRMKESKGICKPPIEWDGLRSRTFTRLPKILNDIDICKSGILEMGLSNRIADTYSPFLVGLWNLVSEHPFLSEKEKNNNVVDFIASAMNELSGKQSTDDEDRIIERILQERIRINPGEEMTIAQMLDAPMSSNRSFDFDGTLERYGIRRILSRKSEKWSIAFSKKSSSLSKILADTPFHDYEEILKRNKFLVSEDSNVKMAGGQNKSVLLDWDKFKEFYLGEDN